MYPFTKIQSSASNFKAYWCQTAMLIFFFVLAALSNLKINLKYAQNEISLTRKPGGELRTAASTLVEYIVYCNIFLNWGHF